MNDVIIKSKQTYLCSKSQSFTTTIPTLYASTLNCKPRVPVETYNTIKPFLEGYAISHVSKQ